MTFFDISCSDSDFHCVEDYLIKKQSGKYSSYGSSSFSKCLSITVVSKASCTP